MNKRETFEMLFEIAKDQVWKDFLVSMVGKEKIDNHYKETFLTANVDEMELTPELIDRYANRVQSHQEIEHPY